MLGLIVTAEPFYNGPAYLLDHDGAAIPGGELPDVPVAVASARDIEWLVTHGQDIEPMLLEKIARSSGGVVGFNNISEKAASKNPILSNAWNAYPWPAREGSDPNSRFDETRHPRG